MNMPRHKQKELQQYKWLCVDDIFFKKILKMEYLKWNQQRLCDLTVATAQFQQG